MNKNISMIAFARRLAMIVAAAVMAGCTLPTQPVDYSEFRAAKPRSILVLPPINKSPDAKGSNGLLAHSTMPLAEGGYYVLPVTLVSETFRENGLTIADEIHAVAPQKLREIFGADAALYLTITQYGTRYMVVSSVTEVRAEAELVSLVTGKSLWRGQAFASSAEHQQTGGGLIGMLVTAALNQVINTATDQGFTYAGIASNRLLFPRPNGLLYGPYHPEYMAVDETVATDAEANESKSVVASKAEAANP